MKVPREEIYEQMKNKMEFPKPNTLRYDTKDDRVKTGRLWKYHMDYGHDTKIVETDSVCREPNTHMETLEISW